MSFFVTSVGLGDGANLRGLDGADRHCQQLAQAAGTGDRKWRAYLSTSAVNARDRIGTGPWFNAKGARIAATVRELHKWRNAINASNALTEKGDVPASTSHDILTGSNKDGTRASDPDGTCSDWTSNSAGRAVVGHHDGSELDPTGTWNSAHRSSSCSAKGLESTGGTGLFYCFALPETLTMTYHASKIADIYRDPPKARWTRRSFLQTITAAGALPLLTDMPAFAQTKQAAGRIRITDIKLQRLRVEKDWGTYVDYMGGRRGGRTGGGAIVEIYSDQGLVGIGPGIAEAAVQPIKEYLSGKDAFDINRHVAVLYGGGREGGLRIPGGGRPVGIEIALWDLIGKAAQQPLYKLWGGTRDRIVPYSSMFRLGPAKERADTAVRLKSEGWKAIKLKSHYATMKEDVAQIEAVRNACGPEFIITTDANKAGFSVSFEAARGVPWSFKRALDTAKEFERLDVFWLEEPLPRYDFDHLAELNRLTSVNLAGGEEQNPGVQEFRWLLEKGCFDVIQPEINTQGVAVMQKVAVIAESMEKLIVPHLGDGRLSTVCDMHLVATWPNAPLLEVGNEGPEGAYEHSYAVFEKPIVLTKDGYFNMPQEPGLGVSIRKDLYEKS